MSSLKSGVSQFIFIIINRFSVFSGSSSPFRETGRDVVSSILLLGWVVLHVRSRSWYFGGGISSSGLICIFVVATVSLCKLGCCSLYLVV